MLPFVRGDPGNLDQVPLMRRTRRRRWNLDRVVDDAGELERWRAGRLADADGAEPRLQHDLAVKGAHRLQQLSMNGVNHDWSDPRMQRQQRTFISGMVVEHVEALPLNRGEDAGEVGG